MFVKSAILLECSWQVADSVKQNCNKRLPCATNQVKRRSKVYSEAYAMVCTLHETKILKVDIALCVC